MELSAETSAPPAPAKEPSAFFVDGLFHPITGLVCVVGVLVALWMPPKGLGFNSCTWLTLTGLPCPGCGLTRSVASTFHGMIRAAWQYNPFGIIIACWFALGGLLLLVPPKRKKWLRNRLAAYETPISLLVIVLVGMMVAHGFLRMTMVHIGWEPYQWWKAGVPPPALQESTPAAQRQDRSP